MPNLGTFLLLLSKNGALVHGCKFGARKKYLQACAFWFVTVYLNLLGGGE